MRNLRAATLLVVALLAPFACQPADSGQEDASAEAEADAVTVTAKDFEFQAPERVASGWNTFRFVNESEEQEHFFVLWKLPEGRTFADYRRDVVETFGDVWNRYDAGDLDREGTLEALGKELPSWFFEELQGAGGAALTEPGGSSQVTLHLEPGTYAIECYVKTPQGTFHGERGMIRELVVTQGSTGMAPPETDAELTLSNYEIAAPDSLSAGRRTLAVDVTDTPEGLVSHDVNLFRIASDTTTVEEIVAWMDWMDLDEFRAPAPGVSMGGVEHLPAGATGYMTVTLEPGRYVWVSEGYGDRGMVHEFTVD